MSAFLDRCQEMWEILSRNRLRTLLTAGSVAWGLFMLVLLLGFGRGLENNVRWMFRDDAMNSIWVYRGRTSRPYNGYGIGRRPKLTLQDHTAVGQQIEGVEALTSRYIPPIPGTVRWGDELGDFEFRAVHPDHRILENTLLVDGRWLNDRDLEEHRKVAVIGVGVVKDLFGDADPIGTWIELTGVLFQVVGVFRDEGGEREEDYVYLPVTTAQGVYGGGESVRQIMFTLDAARVADTDQVESDVRALLAARHGFDPNDRRALRVRNNVAEFKRIQSIFDMLAAFVWVVGLGTVGAGIVGVSNISMVSVAERTTEFGLRKALGATPGSIVRMVIVEALTLTLISGYVGLIAGLLVLEAVRVFAPDNEIVRDPSVPLSTGFAALAILVVAGCIAGAVPAWRAARLNPIDALRDA